MIHDSRCGTCGRTWSSRATPTPSGRCPWEYDHEPEPPTTTLEEALAIELLSLAVSYRLAAKGAGRPEDARKYEEGAHALEYLQRRLQERGFNIII
jgi:hypothetical protein